MAGAHPPDRPNWNSLNISQQKNTIKQYNLGRQRRHLPIYVLVGG